MIRALSRPTPWRPVRAFSNEPVCLVIALACLWGVLAPASASAAIRVIGSPLSVPATLNTAENLSYQGAYTAVPPSPEAPNGIFHTFHYGADTALWNVAQGSGSPRMPAAGQAVKVSLEGCAKPAAGGPPPLTQIHFQDVSPLPGGGARVNLTSQGFEIPVCGQGGASGSTVTTYEPTNLCVSKGDYVALNDEGGYVENVYRAGVPYQVLGRVKGSTADSFLMNGGTGDGALMSPSDRAPDFGFAINQDEELMLQVALGTGRDARYVCAGGTKDAPPVLAPISVHRQTDGINHSRIVAVAIYCRPTPGCKGVATLTLGGRVVSVGHSAFNLRGATTSHLPLRVVPALMGMIRRDNGVRATLSATVAGRTFRQTIDVKIL
jgi:hypothetical protein